VYTLILSHPHVFIQHNVNQRYATNAVTAHIFRELGRKHAEVPFQEFAVRADSRCGSTIGPREFPSVSRSLWCQLRSFELRRLHPHTTVVAGLTGVRTVDVGSPQWAMHSVRECMATSDVYHGYKHFRAVYEHFSAVAAECAEVVDL